MGKPISLMLGVALAVLAAGAAQADGHVSVSGQWMRAVVAGMPAAGYFVLRNDGARPGRLVGASSPDCGRLTLHQTIHKHMMSAMSALDPENARNGRATMPGMSTMQPVAEVLVPARGEIAFAPGGYHLMCERPGASVRPGHSIAVTLRLESGDAVTSRFPVRGARGE